MTTETILPAGFTPGDKDVMVGRGKVCYKHAGNRRLTEIVRSALGTYSASGATKKSKSELIKSIMSQIRDESPDGGFIKFDNESGRWFIVADRIAREKVSQTFRDALNDRYKSSTTSKTLKRRQQRINRQTSTGSKGGSSSDGTNKVDQQEIPEAQARVDALLMAANFTANKQMLPHPGISALPGLGVGMSPYYSPGLLHGFGNPNMMSSMMNPSLANLMAGPATAAAQANYNAMFMASANNEIQQQQQQQAMKETAVPTRPKLEP
ncbi:Nitrilase family, member 2 [Seminavis robusta]|uniref:Nitrilase family, member 2 n=1 Tax=Seminavis robusta TaxID=568900 RepID=A0A9N8HHL7_9STRA|nr:Nitrilase family, member 2 [Seminavis robusta]|eukprot:Sro717_g191970.1 Nitrilase family, member 2 (266) ;mRNA; f:5541-6435